MKNSENSTARNAEKYQENSKPDAVMVSKRISTFSTLNIVFFTKTK